MSERRVARMALRMPAGMLGGLLRRPGYPLAAVTMLGLAVAANTAVFAVVYGFLLRPLPYHQTARLAVVRERLPGIGLNTPLVSPRSYLALKHGLGGIANAGLATWPDHDVVRISHTPRLLGFERVTPSLFRTLGVSPILGRLPDAAAGRPGGPAQAVISYRLWQSAYGGGLQVLGRPLKVGQTAYDIVGVMPRGFFFVAGSSSVQAWLPFVMTAKQARETNINYWMIVRRRPAVSLHRLNLDLAGHVQGVLAQETPSERSRDLHDGYTIDARPLRAIALESSGVGNLPWLLQAAAGLLLLLALANTVNLGLVRQQARQHEYALRHALGASRGRLAALILTEHVPLFVAAGGVAMLLAWAGIHALHVFGLPPAFSPFRITLALPVAAFCWALAGVATLAVALGPALMTGEQRLLANLSRSPAELGGRAARWLQRSLGTVQVALACALVIAGGLLGTSLWKVLARPVGFDPQGRVLATVELPDNVKDTAAWRTLAPRLLGLPGVGAAALSSPLPFSSSHVQGEASKVGSDAKHMVNLSLISSEFFSTLRIPLAAGRAFTGADIASNARVTVVNEALAKRLFGGAHAAVGQSLEFVGKRRIVGVARDIAWAPTPDQYNRGTVYVPFSAYPSSLHIILRTHGPLAPLTHALGRIIRRGVPGSLVIQITTLPHLMRGASIFRATGAGLVGAFAALALLLAALGAYAITSFIARGRLGEYGIRAALGAAPPALLRLGMAEAGWLLAIGVPLGFAGAYLLGWVVASALYHTPVFAPGLYFAGAGVIAAVVFVAAWRPARRAARVPIRNLLGGGASP